MFWLVALIITIVCIILYWKVPMPNFGEFLSVVLGIVFGIITISLIFTGVITNAVSDTYEEDLESLYNEAILMLELKDYIDNSYSFSITNPDFNKLEFTNTVANAVEKYNDKYNYLYGEDNSRCYGSLINMEFLENYKPIPLVIKDVAVIVE